MSDIFISYASPDRLRAKPLAEALRQLGWSVWWDRTILAGKTWDQAIETALAEARCVIVLWSRDSVQSDWVRTEAEEAKRRGILVPALLDDVNIPLAFRRVQAANLVGWNGMLPSLQFDELAKAVAEVVSGNARPDPAPRIALPDEPFSTAAGGGAENAVSQAGDANRTSDGHTRVVAEHSIRKEVKPVRPASKSRFPLRAAVVIGGTAVLLAVSFLAVYLYRSYHTKHANVADSVSIEPAPRATRRQTELNQVTRRPTLSMD